MSVIKRELFLVWRMEVDTSKKKLAVENYIFAHVIDKTNHDNDECDQISKRIRNFTSKLASKWRESNYDMSKFDKNNTVWLDSELILTDLSNSHTFFQQP